MSTPTMIFRGWFPIRKVHQLATGPLVRVNRGPRSLLLLSCGRGLEKAGLVPHRPGHQGRGSRQLRASRPPLSQSNASQLVMAASPVHAGRHQRSLEIMSLSPVARSPPRPFARGQRMSHPGSFWLRLTHAQPALATGVDNQQRRLLGPPWRPCACFCGAATTCSVAPAEGATGRRCRSYRLGTKPASVLEDSMQRLMIPWHVQQSFSVSTSRKPSISEQDEMNRPPQSSQRPKNTGAWTLPCQGVLPEVGAGCVCN
jgi:hypothetical protein